MGNATAVRVHIENEITDKGAEVAAENIVAAINELVRMVELGEVALTRECMRAALLDRLEFEAFGGM